LDRHTTYTNYARKLKELLQRATHGNISEAHLTQLILISCSIAEAYLATFRHSASQLCLQQGLTIVDLSFDCIAEVFGRDQDNKFWQLENFAASLNEEFDQVPEPLLL
jgi:hypothetical protein